MPSCTINVPPDLFEDLQQLALLDGRRSWEESVSDAVEDWVEARKRQVLREHVGSLPWLKP